MDRIEFDFERLCLMENIRTAKIGERHYSHDWISLPCPFCTGDAGNHLGYSKITKVFNCWRCGKHTIGEVLSALLEMPKGEAVKYALEHYPLNPFAPKYTPKQYQRPLELELIGSKTPSEIHIKYLKSRRYDIEKLIDRWDVRFTNEHPTHPYMIIFPIWHKGRFVSYVGRDVTKLNKNKYMTCMPSNEVINNKHCVWGMQHAIKYDSVIVTEGIFDALRIGEGAIATLGTGFSEQQVQLIGKQFLKSYILYDNEFVAQQHARLLSQKLNLIDNHKSKVINITDNTINDPSDLNDADVQRLREMVYA